MSFIERKAPSSNPLQPQGFTLVELMVVVALIGILTSIAIPNYQKFTARTRQTAAKIALSAIFTSLKSFYVEQGTYSGCLKQAGYFPETGAIRYYTIGIRVPGGPMGSANACGPNGVMSCFDFDYAGDVPCTPANTAYNAALTLADNAYPANAKVNPAVPSASLDVVNLSSGIDQSSFQAAAIGSISNSTTLDQWTIDQQRVLKNSVSGI